MPVSDSTVREFQQIILDDYGANLSFDSASAAVRDFINFFDSLAEANKNDYENKDSQNKILD